MSSPVLRGVDDLAEDAPDAVFRDVLERAIKALETADVPYLLIGGVGSATLGRPRWTRDIDVLVQPIDADRALEALGDNGFDTDRTNPHWIYKATSHDIVVDVIFRTVGDIYLDDDMKEHAQRADFRGIEAMVASPEDQIVIKAIAHDEQSARHWNDALSLIASCEIDWEYLIDRAARGARRVLSLLIYAQSSDLVVPSWTIERLYRQIYEP